VSGLVLASGSATRLEMLRNAGVTVIVDKPDVDEGEVKARCRSTGRNAIETALELAKLKALVVSKRRSGGLVLGADQMLDVGGVWLDKPVDRVEARRHLLILRDRAHHLETAAVLVRDGELVRSWTDRATLTARAYSEAFVEWYLNTIGDAALWSVGAYQLEGLGARLFERIEGDHFTILGLPLLPILNDLVEEGVLLR